MKQTESIGPKERKALVYLDDTVQATGLIPSQRAIERAVGIKSGMRKMRTFRARYHQHFLGAKTRQEANALACLDRLLAATSLVPTKAEIARAIGGRSGSLRRMRAFGRCYREALSRYRPKVRPPCKNPAAQAEKATTFLDERIRATGRRPSLSEIARFVGVERGTLLRQPKFASSWGAALAYKPRRSGGGRNSYNASLEDQAIKLLNAQVDSTGIRPSLQKIARRLKVDRSTLVKRPRFMELWQDATPRAKPQRPGPPPNATEDQALAYLADAIRSTGHRPAKRAIARALGIAHATLEAWQRFSTAHRAAPRPPPSRGGRSLYKAGLEDLAIKLLNAQVDSTGIRPSVRTIARQLKAHGSTLASRPRFMALWQAAKMRSKPQRPGRQPNATEDQALDYLADAIRSTGHRPAKRTIARALGIHQATLDGWQRFKAAHRAAPPNPTWLRLFGRLKPAAEPQTPPAADAGTDRDKIPTEEAPAVVSHHDDRDKCIYEEARKGTAWERIASKVSNQGEWEPLTLQGCILAAKRYANRHRLPLPPPRKQGRPAAAK